MPVSLVVSFAMDFKLVRCYEQFEFKKCLWALNQPYSGAPVFRTSSVACGRAPSFQHPISRQGFDYWLVVTTLTVQHVSIPAGYLDGEVMSKGLPLPCLIAQITAEKPRAS